jgi:hypothetical protein
VTEGAWRRRPEGPPPPFQEGQILGEKLGVLRRAASPPAAKPLFNPPLSPGRRRHEKVGAGSPTRREGIEISTSPPPFHGGGEGTGEGAKKIPSKGTFSAPSAGQGEIRKWARPFTAWLRNYRALEAPSSPGSRAGTRVARAERGALAPHLCLSLAVYGQAKRPAAQPDKTGTHPMNAPSW